LRALVDATLRAKIEAERGLALVNGRARLRVAVAVSRTPPAGGAAGDDVALEFHVIDVGDADEAAAADEAAGTRREDDSILGGVVPCRMETLDATCTAVVKDLGKFAQMERDFEAGRVERMWQQLKAGETDLIDDDEVRSGDR
jgi:hypothetical protein